MNEPPSIADDMITELRGGIRHFAIGQHRAWKDDDDTVLLRYVDVLGWMVIVVCVRDGDAWRAGVACRLTATGLRTQWTETDMELSERMLAAIGNAEVLA